MNSYYFLSFDQTVKTSKMRLTSRVAKALSGKTAIVTASTDGIGFAIAKRLAQDVAAGKLDPESVDEETLPRYLDTHVLPDPDLVIRTSGEARISNFLLWQSAYAEYEFIDTLWPDFTSEELARLCRNWR